MAWGTLLGGKIEAVHALFADGCWGADETALKRLVTRETFLAEQVILWSAWSTYDSRSARGASLGASIAWAVGCEIKPRRACLAIRAVDTILAAVDPYWAVVALFSHRVQEVAVFACETVGCGVALNACLNWEEAVLADIIGRCAVVIVQMVAIETGKTGDIIARATVPQYGAVDALECRSIKIKTWLAAITQQ